jgi:hypothetical protein
MEKNKFLQLLKLFSASTLIILTSIFFIYHLTQGTFDRVNPNKNIILVALPKSGSTYLMTTLQANLNYNIMSPFFDIRQGPPGIPTYADNHQLVKTRHFSGDIDYFFQKKSTLTRDHYRAPSADTEKQFGSPMLKVNNIKKYMNKIVLHLRDPRQALLSYVHHLNNNKHSPFASPDLTDMPHDLSEYHTFDFNGQLDWAIENVLPPMLVWINDWLDFKQKEDASPNGLKILVTTYDELIQDEMGLYHKIADFYDLSLNDANFKRIAKNEGVRFRKGDPNEWKSVFTDAQKNRMAEIVPIDLLQRFHWEQ